MIRFAGAFRALGILVLLAVLAAAIDDRHVHGANLDT